MSDGPDPGHPVGFRPATAEDLPAIVALLADDPLGASRESPDDLSVYVPALRRILADPYQHLVVAVRDTAGGEQVVATAQLSVVTTLSRRGTVRGIVEAVRVGAGERGAGLGARLMEHVAELARGEGCTLLQLTSDRSRTDAHRFYERLGYAASHVGFKRELGRTSDR